jgi:polyisoprenoid-binding protein YceI
MVIVRAIAAVSPLFLLAATAPPTALAYRVDPAGSNVAAKVAFMGLGSRTASFPAVSGAVTLSPAAMERIDLDVRIDARQLKASDQLTTDRLKGKNFFDVVNHPAISFRGKALVMKTATTGTVTGDLTARGVTKPVTLAVTFTAPPARATGRESIGLTGTTTINRRDFGMTAYSLIVGKKVAITIRTRLVPG